MINYYHILGIYTKGTTFIPIKELSDEEILKKYQEAKNRIIALIQDAMLIEAKTDEEKERKNRKIYKLQMSLQQVNDAFKEIETKEKREKFEEEYDKHITSEILLRRLARYQGQSLESLEEKRINISNRANDVREDKSHIPYTPLYKGSEIQLLELAKIKFLNGPNINDQLHRYMLLLKKDDGLMPLGYDFYTDNIIVEKLEDPEYRAVFCEAIKRAILKGERYIGEVNKDVNQKYFISIDDGRKSAVKEHQIQLENARKSKEQNYEER